MGDLYEGLRGLPLDAPGASAVIEGGSHRLVIPQGRVVAVTVRDASDPGNHDFVRTLPPPRRFYIIEAVGEHRIEEI